MTKLEADRDMELEEKQKLEEEIRAKVFWFTRYVFLATLDVI